MHHSLNKLQQLPSHTLVYCTHEYTLANLAFAKAVEPNNQALLKTIEACEAKRENNQITLPSTIEKEQAINPFLRSGHPDVQSQAKSRDPNLTDDSAEHEIFAAIRAWKDVF